MKHTDIADPTATPAAPSVPRRPTVALALGAGGAKGLAHIGAIEEIEAQGFEIIAIAGCSMGALIGGIYAMGKLEVYRDWVSTLAKFDVLKLLDWTFSGGGFIKGERIMGTLLELIGDTCIEELPLAFTAVATDLEREREVWLTRGSLFDAIRASIAIPTVFRPYHLNGRRTGRWRLVESAPGDTADSRNRRLPDGRECGRTCRVRAGGYRRAGRTRGARYPAPHW
jgi:NTE family protein